MFQNTKTTNKLTALLLALVMLLSLVPGMSITAYAAANNIIINSAEHGSVTANPTSAESGTTVTLTAQPDNGYKLKNISAYKGIDGSDSFSYVEYKKNYDGSYFTLQSNLVDQFGFALRKAQVSWNSDNTIIISSKSDSIVIDSVVLNAQWLYGNVTVTSGEVTRDNLTITINNINSKSITICTDSGDTSNIKSATVYGKNNADYEELTLTPTGDPNVYTFTMPDSVVSVSAEFLNHEHNFTSYAVNATGDTITATCSPTDDDDECTLENNTATLTIAPSSSGGSTAEFTGDTGEFDLTGVEITYKKKDSTGWQGSATPGENDTGFYEASATIVEGKTISVKYGVSVITKGTGDGNGCSFEVPKVAGVGAKIKPTLTLATGYEVKKITVKDESGNDVSTAVSADTEGFIMPEYNVTVSAAFEGKPTTATLNVTGNGGTTCSAKLLDSSYNEISSVNKKAGEQFILLVNRDDGYDFNVTYGTDSPVTLTEFTENEYEAYVDYAKENNLAVSSGMILAWATMPGVAGDSVSLKVAFSELQPFTILYKTSNENTTEVWCKFAYTEAGSLVTASAQMNNDTVMGDGTKVYSLKVTAAFNPEKVAFVTDASSLESAAMGNATVSQNTDSWNNTDGGKYLIIGGNAKTVIAAFVTDANAIPVYNSSRDMDKTTGGVEYRLAVVVNGNPGSVTTPAAPASSDESLQFDKWSALVGIAPNKTEMLCEAHASVSITENTSFNATWKPAELTVTLNRNGGSGGSGNQTVTYNNPLPALEPPTRYSFAFDGWTVSNTVTEGGELFVKGTPFADLNTPITADMGLTAQWKHVHTYTCYRITLFPNLAQYHKNDSSVHVAVCGCRDARLEAHAFDASGKCACGYQKPEPQPVNLDISYVKDIDKSVLYKGLPQPMYPKQGDEVIISAPDGINEFVFTKWQYSTDKGQTWDDLAATTEVGFIIPCDLKVRALYISTVMKPQVELSARAYEQEVQVGNSTKKADNILFQMNYKLPDGYTFVDAGVRLGDNDGIVYYELKEKTTELGTGGKIAQWAGCIFGSLLSGGPEIAETSSTQTYYEVHKNSALDEMSATELARYMYENKPVSVKAEPILYESKATTKGSRGSVATLTPLALAQAENQNNWIYGIGWLRYKKPDGTIETIYTDALAATVKLMPTKTVTNQGS